ncbi:MAG: beta-mannosidase [Prevotella sp.]|nr:beta-mannosidase [Prevotella sp.]
MELTKKTTVVLAAMVLLATAACAKTPVEKLRARLAKLQKKGIMIGHQDDPFYGTTWAWERGRSDVKAVCGDYPAVMGFELGQIELDSTKNLDGVPFDWMREEIVAHHERGGIVTISWHPWNPVTGRNAWDPSGNPVREVLRGGSQHRKFEEWLLTVAGFLNSLKTAKGEPVPVIFRPWHEMHGGWFWWGKASCTPEEFQHLFQFTVKKLQRLGVSNCLYCYSPGGTPGETEENYMKFYPGDEYVDMMGVDIYAGTDKDRYIKEVREEFKIICYAAQQRGKLVCFAETGYRNTPDPDWFTTGMWEAIRDIPMCYVLLWRNAWDQPEENFGPAPDKSCANDFRKLYREKRALFMKDIK